ncbi:HAD family phosphatase [Patescibacteria group bacterium]|nr:HAD family phosphatase [Patescibacteria group bacterium]
MNSKKKGVIYDLDGTILSTAKLHEEGWKEAGKHHNVEITEDFLKNQKGITNELAARQVLGNKFEELGESFVKIKDDYTVQNTSLVRLYEDFLDAYKKLTEKNIDVWICTSATKKFALTVFDSLQQLQPLTDKTVYREMYTHGKPDPEPILLTAKFMGIPIQDCAYIGDAYSDYLASKNAGCNFIYFCRDLNDRDLRIPENIPIISNHTQILSLVG